jgi:pimeloyl-ACP methyl ester carboxylesterase
MATFVLVPGMWLGAWAWRDVTAALRGAGHDVYPVTLTGLAERAHLTDARTGTVDLDTHVDDVLRLLEAEGLRDVTLAGHSYGGLPVTAVAERAPERLAKVVYVDSGPLPAGTAQFDLNPPEEQDRIRELAGDSGLVPPRTWEPANDPVNLAGLDADALALLRTRCTPHPFASITQPRRAASPASTSSGSGSGSLGGSGGDRPAVATVLVACTFPVEQVHALIEAGNPMFAGLAGARIVGLPTGHWPMFSEPKRLAELLDGLT